MNPCQAAVRRVLRHVLRSPDLREVLVGSQTLELLIEADARRRDIPVRAHRAWFNGKVAAAEHKQPPGRCRRLSQEFVTLRDYAEDLREYAEDLEDELQSAKEANDLRYASPLRWLELTAEEPGGT